MGDKYIGLAKNSDDITSAIQLVKKVFDENNKKENLIFPEESLKLKNIVVVKIDDNIVATCLIHNRLFYFKGKKIPSAFLCFICVDKKMRGKGISKELMNFTIKICKKNMIKHWCGNGHAFECNDHRPHGIPCLPFAVARVATTTSKSNQTAPIAMLHCQGANAAAAAQSSSFYPTDTFTQTS